MKIITDQVAMFEMNNPDYVFDMAKKLNYIESNVYPEHNINELIIYECRLLKNQKYDKDIENFRDIVCEELVKNFDIFIKEFNLNYEYNHFAFGVRKHMSGTYFAPHQDEGYTQIMYLNDDYEGGEFILNDINFILKPKKGDIVIFEGTMTHSISKILSGTRYAIITTFHRKTKNEKFF